MVPGTILLTIFILAPAVMIFQVNLRKDFKVYLVDHASLKMKLTLILTSNCDVLSILFHKIREKKLAFFNSLPSVIERVHVFRQKTHTSITPTHHSLGYLKKLCKKWQRLQKRAKDTTLTQKSEEEFQDNLENISDIVSFKLLHSVDIKTDSNAI